MTHRPRLIASLVLAGAAAVLALLLLTLSGSARSAPTRATNHAQSAEVAGSATTLNVSEFGVFSHISQPADVLPSGSPYGAGTSRRIGPATGPIGAWAVLNGDQLCVTVQGSPLAAQGWPAACNSPSELAKPDQLLTLEAGASGPGGTPRPPLAFIAGLVPDGVRTVTVVYKDGTGVAAPVTNNGFVVNTDGKATSAVKWSSPDGATHTE